MNYFSCLSYLTIVLRLCRAAMLKGVSPINATLGSACASIKTSTHSGRS